MLINNPNNQENSYEKSKKFITKFALGTFGMLASSGTLVLITKLIYDKINNKNIESKKIKYKIKLDTNDKKFIAKNFFLCKWGAGINLCWNDVFIQFLMLPDIRCGNYKSEKIMKTINWINKILGEKYDGDPMNRKIEVPLDVRPVSDGRESWLTDGATHSDLFFGRFNGVNLQNMGIFSDLVTTHPFPVTGSMKLCPHLHNCRRYLTTIGDSYHPIEKAWDTNKIFSQKAQGYYPTFIIVYDDVNTPPHFHAYYVIYDRNQEVKYFLWVNDLTSSMKVLPKNIVLEELKKFKRILIVYSRSDIIERHYTVSGSANQMY